MTTSEKKDIPDKADAKQAGIPEQILSDDSLEDVTGGCCGDNQPNRAPPKDNARPDKWGGLTR
jgi:hypothetical protein